MIDAFNKQICNFENCVSKYMDKVDDYIDKKFIKFYSNYSVYFIVKPVRYFDYVNGTLGYQVHYSFSIATDGGDGFKFYKKYEENHKDNEYRIAKDWMSIYKEWEKIVKTKDYYMFMIKWEEFKKLKEIDNYF